MRLICENCDSGYDPQLGNCRWCGSPSFMAHVTNDNIAYLDTECYPNYWLCSLIYSNKQNTAIWRDDFELFPDTVLDVKALTKALSRYTIYTFNGIGYDVPMIANALLGATCEQLKRLSDDIIKNGAKWWTLPGIDWLDHIDMMNVAPGAGGLKMYGAKMHTKRLQDLPYDPDHKLDWYETMRVREYCGNDLTQLQELCETLKPAIELREAITKAEGVDVRSKSGPQIAEAVFKRKLGRKVYPPSYPAGTRFYFRPAPWMQFIKLDILPLLARCPFTITETGHAALADELAETVIKIGGTEYQMGAGGLHSKEKSVSYHATHDESLSDWDVASYYPASIINTGIFPPQLGEQFKVVYKAWRDDRIVAKEKAAELKKELAGIMESKSERITQLKKEIKHWEQESDAKKLGLNGTFGKLLERYSIFYAPSEGMQVTITGQVALLMLIERLELCGISVVSANTDGILVKCKRYLEPLRDAILKQWEALTGYDLEHSDYTAIYIKDVNNYTAIKASGQIKLKGVFAEPIPTASNWPAPSGQICVTAIVQYLTAGTPVEDTIRSCRDIRQFVYVRAAKGGAVFTPKPQFDKKPGKRYEARVLEEHGFDSYTDLLQWSQSGTEYLGKTVRWYYAKGSTGSIRYQGSNNLVARTDGCKPVMTLPDELPDDIDYAWYEKETYDLLMNIDALKL